MIDPFGPLSPSHPAPHIVSVGDFMPNAADPGSAQGVMIIGIIIIVATACWVIGALSAAVWVPLNERRERRFHTVGR